MAHERTDAVAPPGWLAFRSPGDDVCELDGTAKRFVVAHPVRATDEIVTASRDPIGDRAAGKSAQHVDRWWRRERLGHQGEAALREADVERGIVNAASSPVNEANLAVGHE